MVRTMGWDRIKSDENQSKLKLDSLKQGTPFLGLLVNDGETEVVRATLGTVHSKV